MYYLVNAFSPNMLHSILRDRGVSIILEPLPDVVAAADALAMVDPQGRIDRWPGEEQNDAIGHADTDRLVRSLLAAHGYDPGPGERVTVALEWGDAAILAPYVGSRLPEGATSLPEGAAIEWYRITLKQPPAHNKGLGKLSGDMPPVQHGPR